jgi:CheY-like chemotaxis protein
MARDGTGPAARQLRVLIVEDELLIADFVQMIVEDAGHSVLGIARTATEALAVMERTGGADLVTLDMKLAGDMDGVDLARVVRDRFGTPFVFMTGSAEAKSRARCEAERPMAVLQKPFRVEALEQVLASLCSSAAAAAR